MRKLLLFILFAATTISVPPQTITTTTPIDSSFELRVEALMNDINKDLTKATEEKETVDKKLQMNKLMVAEKNRRIDQILRKINNKSQNREKTVVKTVPVPTKQRYSVKKDSACLRKELFSSKCVKWDVYYMLVDSKTNDTVMLKRQ
jgi:hypothetical protein